MTANNVRDDLHIWFTFGMNIVDFFNIFQNISIRLEISQNLKIAGEIIICTVNPFPSAWCIARLFLCSDPY